MNLEEIKRRNELGLLMCLGIMEGFSWTLIKPMLPLFATNIGATTALVGVIVAVPPLVQIFTRIPSGAAASRYGKRRMIMLSFMVTMVGALILTLTKTPLLLFPAQICVALGETLFWPANWAYVTSLAPRRRQGSIVAMVMGVQGLAGLALPYLAGRIFDVYGFWLNGLIYTVFIGIGLVVSRRLPYPEPVPDHDTAEGGEAPAATNAGRAAAAAGTAAAATARVRPAPNAGMGLLGSLAAARRLLAREQVLLAAWGGIIIFFSWGISSVVYSIYIRDVLGFTATTVGMLMTWNGIFVSISRFSYARLSANIPVDRAMLGAAALNSAAMMMMPWVRNLPMLMLVSAITGCAAGIVPVAIKTLYANATSDNERSLAMGLDGVAMNFGALVSPLLAGVTAQSFGIPATFFAGNLLTLIALAMSRKLTRSRRILRSLSGLEPVLAGGGAAAAVRSPGMPAAATPSSGGAAGPASGAGEGAADC